MSAKKKETAGFDAPEQDENVRRANLKGVAPSEDTASGIAARQLFGQEPERPENEGSTVPIAGGEPQPDLQGIGAPPEPTGAQAQQATFVSNGTVPAGMAASPSGFVSAAALHTDPAEALRVQTEQVNTATRQGNLDSDDYGPRLLTSEEIDRADANILRAAALDRGLDLGPMRGNRGTRAAFREAQNRERTRREELMAGENAEEGVVGDT